jgi:hypothetical protein
MGLRYVLVEGDFLVGCTGVILPVGRSSPALAGIPVAFIGDMVQCFICGDVKPIEKDGGPYRIGIFSGEVDISVFDVVHATEEFAYEHDVIYCKCGKKPLEALLARVKQAKDSEDVPVAYIKGATEGALALGWDMVKGTLLYASDATNGALNTLTGGALEKYAPGTFSESIKRNQATGQAIIDAPGNALDTTRRALNRRESLAEQGYNAVSNWWDKDVASHNATDPRLAAYNATRGILTAGAAVAPVTRLGRLGTVAEVGDVGAATRAATIRSNVAESAAARSSSNFEQLPRFETAYSTYRDAGYSADRALSHISGIDRTQPVTRVTLPEGGAYVQHVQDGRVGNYFALPGTPAEMLGINPASRVPTTFSTAQPTSALQSTAAPIVDTWTVPDTSFNAQGGGTQFFVPNNSTLIIGK